MKGPVIVFIKGIFMLLLGLYLASLGLPSDETDVALHAGNAIIDTLNQTANSPQVSEVAQSTKSTFVMLGFLSGLIGVVEIIGSGIAAFHSVSRY